MARRRFGVTASATFSRRVHWRMGSPCGQWTARQSLDGSMAASSRHAGLLVKCARHLADRHPPRDGVIKPLWRINLKPNLSTKCMGNCSSIGPRRRLPSPGYIMRVQFARGKQDQNCTCPQQYNIELRLEIRRHHRIASRRLPQQNKHTS